MAEKKQKNGIDKLSFEEAIKELTSIVGKIEQGQIPLQDSLEQYEKGMALSNTAGRYSKKPRKESRRFLRNKQRIPEIMHNMMVVQHVNVTLCGM
jgi:exodeoxyribonuclease VII small subunit